MEHKYKNIEINPEIMLGKPVIQGTRIPVELIIRKLGEGVTIEELLEAFPNLTKEDIYEALKYAADVLENEKIILIGSGSRSWRNKILNF